MGNLNKVMLIGNLTRDPEVRNFSNGGKVAKFGFAVSNRRKNAQTGQWENVPVWLDVEAFNRGEYGKTADLVEQYLRRGSSVFIEGHLQLDEWTSQDGQKRSKLKIVVDNIQFLERKGEGASPPRTPSAPRAEMPPEEHYPHEEPGNGAGPARSGPGEEDIPF